MGQALQRGVQRVTKAKQAQQGTVWDMTSLAFLPGPGDFTVQWESVTGILASSSAAMFFPPRLFPRSTNFHHLYPHCIQLNIIVRSYRCF